MGWQQSCHPIPFEVSSPLSARVLWTEHKVRGGEGGKGGEVEIAPMQRASAGA